MTRYSAAGAAALLDDLPQFSIVIERLLSKF
jgi:hypothetical protein